MLAEQHSGLCSIIATETSCGYKESLHCQNLSDQEFKTVIANPPLSQRKSVRSKGECSAAILDVWLSLFLFYTLDWEPSDIRSSHVILSAAAGVLSMLSCSSLTSHIGMGGICLFLVTFLCIGGLITRFPPPQFLEGFRSLSVFPASSVCFCLLSTPPNTAFVM